MNPLPRAPLFRRAPLFPFSIGICLGILAASYFSVPAFCAATALAVAAAFVVAARFVSPLRKFFFPVLCLAAVALGSLLTLAHRRPVPDIGHSEALAVTLIDTPRETPRCQKVPATLHAVLDSNGHWQRQGGRVMLYIAKDSSSRGLGYGDGLVVRCHPRQPDSSVNPYQFDYRQFLARKGIGWQCHVPKGGWREEPQLQGRKGLRYQSKLWQQRLVQRIRGCRLTPEQQGIAEALLLGWREDLDEETQQQYRTAGIAHLLCVSGLHVGILAQIVGLCLFFLGRRRGQRIAKSMIQVLAIWLFVLLTGMAPSTLRAGVMFTVLFVGEAAARRSSSLNSLALSALVLLFCDPMMLFDVGFQLSYTAVLGILALQEPLQGLLPVPEDSLAFHPLWKVWQWVCLSTAAQLGTLPLVLHYFHQFPTYFLIANLTVVPLSGVLLFTVIATVLLAGVPLLGGWAAAVLQWEIAGIDGLTRWVASLPNALLDNLYCDIPMALLVAAALLMLVVLLRRRQIWALPLMAACLLAVGIYATCVETRAQRQNEVVAYSAGRHLAIELFQGRQSYLIGDGEVAQSGGEVLDFQRSNLLNRRCIRSSKVLSADTCFNDGHCLVSGHCIVCPRNGEGVVRPYLIQVVDSSNRWMAPSERRHVDLLVVAPRVWVDEALMEEWYSPDTVVHCGEGAAMIKI